MNLVATDYPSLELELPNPVNESVADDIQKESVFVAPQIERIRVSEGGRTAKLVLRDAAAADMDAVVDKAKRFLATMAKPLPDFDIKVFVENARRDGKPYVADVNEGLIERGWMHDYGKGQVALSGPVLKLARMIDATAARLYGKAFDVQDGQYPALIDADTLQKCGYFDSHPNAVTFLGNMMEDFDAIEEFRVANSCSEGAIMPPHEHVHVDGMCLNPAACFPCYPTLTGKTIDGASFSWLGRVFRYESRNIQGLDRLYEFNVRELVFVGSEDYVRDCRKKALPIVQQLAETFDLDCKLQTATDPFFATVSAAKKFWQAAQEVKNEIKIPVLDGHGGTKQLACGSVNLHGNFFGQRFQIADGQGGVAHTGCVGLGIERWVLACFTQHGFDETRWPTDVAEEIFG